MSQLQAVLFDNTKFNTRSAHDWLKYHGYHPIKPAHITDNYIRFRLREPTNKHYRTIALTKDIRAIIELPSRRRVGKQFRSGKGAVWRTRVSPYIGVTSRGGRGLDPVDLFANMVLPALMYAGISYGVYRAVKK